VSVQELTKRRGSCGSSSSSPQPVIFFGLIMSEYFQFFDHGPRQPVAASMQAATNIAVVIELVRRVIRMADWLSVSRDY
jgi:hypothetical protein